MAQAPEDIRHAYKTYRHYRRVVAEQECDPTLRDAKRSSTGREEDALCPSDSCDANSRVSVLCGDESNTSKTHDSTTEQEVVVSGVCDAGKVIASDLDTHTKGDDVNSSDEAKTSPVIVTSKRSETPAKFANTSTSVWGRHLNKNSQSQVTKKVDTETSFYSKMAEKLRVNSTIKTRKSLSRSSSVSKPQSKLTSSQPRVCDDSINNRSNESRVSCISDASYEKIKRSEEDTLLNDTNTLDTFDQNDVFDASFNNTVDALKPLSVLDTMAATPKTTLTPSNNKTSEKLQTFSNRLDELESNSYRTQPCRTPPISNITSKSNPFTDLDEIDLNPFQDSSKNRGISSSIKSPITQPVGALASLSQPHTSGLTGVKKRASLNLAWVARCTGMTLDDTITAKQTMPQDNWKMKLIDKEWTGDNDNDDDVIGVSQAPPSPSLFEDDNDDYIPPSTTTTKRKNNPKPTKKTVKQPVKNTRKKPAAKTIPKKTVNSTVPKAPKRKVNAPLPPQSQAGRVLRTRSIRNSTPLNYTDLSDEDEGYSGSGGISQRGEKRKSVDEDDLWQDMGEREESEADEMDERTSNCGGEEITSLEREEVSNQVCVRKRKKETIEELEEQGKIQSQWPPPKKNRIARKKPVTRKNVKKVGKENSPQKKRPIRKRRKIEEEEEENEEEVDTPDTPSEKSTPTLDYNEIEDIESHGTKATKPRGKYFTKEERLMNKISSGTLNNNYVRINLKKKVFVRGKKTMTSGKYKRQEWKKKQVMKSAESGNPAAIKNLTCFRCGDFGHWANKCPGKRGDNLAPLETYDENESTFLSLEEAASMALGIKKVDSGPVTKLYVKNSEQKEGDGNIVNPTNDNEVNMSRTPAESQEKTGDAKESEGINDENEVMNNENEPLPQTMNQEHDGGENDTTNQTQNTDTQQTDKEDEYEFRDSDDDIFGNLEESDFIEQEAAPSSTQNTITNSTLPPSAPPSYNTHWQDRPSVDPLYTLEGDEVIPTPDEVHEALSMFGYSSFRPGQENAIMRILSGQSTLLVLSTGSGKSLCYQLPAYLYSQHRSPCITLCVSPLVSLMEDQVTGLPGFLKAVCLHTHQNPTQRSNAIKAIHSRAAHILLVSPEAVVASRTGGVLGTLLKELPPVAFACLDEAHCVSEWSHNFRPSYLRVCQVLRERLGVKTILGLTATARTATALSIARHLLITDFNTGVIRGTSVPSNLQLSVSRDRNRAEAMVSLLQGERFSGCNSIIIYCTRRDECERVATLIRTQLLNPSKVDVKSNLKRSRGLSFDAEAYHAGLSSYRRNQVQKRFMSGKLRIVVATVAFGMGIDKSDVQGIIHYNMPRNVESYVQEIGRAGRNGDEAHCHLFLDDQDGKDIQELKRHIFANSLDRHTIRKLLNKIFKPCTCAKLKNLSTGENENGNTYSNMPSSPVRRSSSVCEDDGMMATGTSSDPFCVATTASNCPRHEVAIPIDTVVEELDLPEENLETLLCYLELHQDNLIRINSHVYANCSVACYGGPRQLVAVSRRCPPLAVAIALEHQKGTDFSESNSVSFPVVEVASRMGWNSKIVKRELKSLEWSTLGLQCGGKVKRSGVMVEMTDLSFHLEARGDLSDDERDQVLDAVYRRTQVQEQEQLRQLHYTYQLLRSISHSTILFCCDTVDQERCNRLRTELKEYFRSNQALAEVHIEERLCVNPEVENGIRNSVRAFLSTYEDQQWTGRAVARVFHGIGSPNYPTETWGRVRRYWRQHLTTDFNVLVRLATQEILRCK